MVPRILFLFFVGLAGLAAYEIPAGVSGMGELDKAMARAKASGKPVALVVAYKTQPET